MKKGRRIVSIFIAILLCIQLMPAIAAETIAAELADFAENADISRASVNEFKEVTSDLTYKYYNGTGWKTFSGQMTVEEHIDRVQISTSGKPYRFYYKAGHEGKWQSPVLSTSQENYAVIEELPITNLAIEVYEGPVRIYDNYVVMYRARVNGEWLDWVSNGRREVMESIKGQFELDGKLDVAATDAGWYTRGCIQALEIRVFERIGYTGTPYEEQFQEIDDFTQEYYLNETWYDLNADVRVDHMDGVRLGTGSEAFYLRYNSVNVNSGKLPSVFSTDSGPYDYAGLPDDPMTNLSIEVYTGSGIRIYDDYVVMYRARVNGEWLDWVSNGQPDVMRTIQYEFNLEGGLDTSATDAGWASRGNIQALEIRIFERINDAPSGGPIETGAFQPAEGIEIQYCKNGDWYDLDGSVPTGQIEGVRLQTHGSKPYYLQYRARNPGYRSDWLSFVSSDNSGNYDYAGLYGYPMSQLEIRVYTQDGQRIYDDFVVMYRAKVNGSWLGWASNGWPPIMESIQNDFQLAGELDGNATNAGLPDGSLIEDLEIQVYERKGLVAQPSENAKIIDAPYINQNEVGLPNGCESVSTVMALQYLGVEISPEQFVTNYLDMGPAPSGGIGSNPYDVFVGDPHLTNGLGWGCYAPVIVKAVNKFADRENLGVTELSQKPLEELCSAYIDNNIPVILWGTLKMTSQCSYSSWITPDGNTIQYNNKLHCLLLVGYDENYYYFNDPLRDVGGQKYVGYAKEDVETAYDLLGKQAVVITNQDPDGPGASGNPGISESPEIPPQESETVGEPSEIPKKDPIPDEYVEDPIDLSSGAHVIQNTLMTINGAQTLSLVASYRSNLLTVGSLGTGWSHNYEKRLVDHGNMLWVYDNPTYYAVYNQGVPGSTYYTTDTPTKEGYGITKTTTGYVVNCNSKVKEYYDNDGKLYRIVTKDGFTTLLEYPDANTIKITDQVSGRYMTLVKNTDGKITSVTDNAGRTCTLGYTDDFLTSITDENGNLLTYEYNENGQVERGIDGTGSAYFTDTYDSIGRVITQKDGLSDSVTTVIQYDEASDPDYTLVKVTDRTMQTTVYKYNAAKQLVSKTDPSGIEIQYEYDTAGNLTKKTDGLGNSVTNVYDAKNNLIESIDARGNKTQYTYDNRNNLTNIQYPGGGTVTNTYDTKNRLMTNTDLRGVVTTYEYNGQNQVIKTTYDGKSITYTYADGQVASVTDPLGRTTENQYNEAGFLISSTDEQDNTTSYTYDQKGNVLTVTDPEDNVSSMEYDVNGNVIRETDANGNTTTYTYNNNLCMTSMTPPTGATILYEYDGEDRPVRTIYPDGTYTMNEYDASGRVIRQTDADGNTTSYTYDDAGNVTQITDPIGGVTKQEYDAAGNLTKSTKLVQEYDMYEYLPIEGSFLEHSTTYTYDVDGRLSKTVNAVGGETVYTYNDAGDLLTVTDPVGNITENTYDALGNLLSVEDPRGNVTSYTYDAVGNLLTTENALGQITTNTYDSANRLIETEDPCGHTTSYTYDALGRITATTDPRGNTVHQYYDALGNVIKITNASGHTDYEAVYDVSNRPVSVTNAAGKVTTNRYDWAGNLTLQIDPMGYESSYIYNGAGQMIGSTDKAGGESSAVYDGAGNLTSMTGPEGETKEYTYNSAGQMYKKSDSYRNERTLYNALGLKEKVVGTFWEETDYYYDASGRMTGYWDNAGRVTYTFDANGNRLTASDSTGTVSREYDALNRVTKYTDIYDNVIEYEYDACGNLIKMTYPTGEVAVYTYDENHNMLTSGLEGSNYVTKYTYNAQNQITKIENPDGSVVTRSYDGAGRLSSFTEKDKNGDIITSGTFGYDSMGRMINENYPSENRRYVMEYDEMGRIIKRTEYGMGSGSPVLNEETFSYDGAGNILEASKNEKTDTYTYDTTNNSITGMNDTTYGVNFNYGALGQYVLDGEKVQVTYDARKRMKQVDGGAYEYWYDAENNRINMYAVQTNTKYTYDCSGGRHRLVWTIDHNYKETIYGYGADGLAWSLSDGEYQIYHYDYRGSVVAVTDIEGNVTDTIKYDTYGGVAERTGDSQLIFGYNGRDGVLTDPNGLLYMRTRYYNTDLKRFMSPDIIDGSIADSSTLNVYAYVNGNPISYVDPFGLSAERGNNDTVLSELKGLYDLAYNFYSNVNYNVDRIKFANDAVMKYIIYQRFYESGGKTNEIAWQAVAGNIDYSFIYYAEEVAKYRSLQTAVFYDPSSLEEIDFVHMIATLNANTFDRFGWGGIDYSLNAYAGWVGDLITLAGEIQDQYDANKNIDIVQEVLNLMSDSSSFSRSDLLADIDAVLIARSMENTPIYQVIESYYQSDYANRYELFLQEELGGSVWRAENIAKSYLYPSVLTNKFKDIFNSSYSKKIIPDIAKGFAEYIGGQAGR